MSAYIKSVKRFLYITFRQGVDSDNYHHEPHCEKFAQLRQYSHDHNKGSKPVPQFVAQCPHGSTIYNSDRNESDTEIQGKLS
jgi:hypothetical protein